MPDASTSSTTLPYATAINVDARPERRLSLFDSVCIIAGVIIGAGIFQTGDKVAGAASGPTTIALFWLAGGFVSLIGALCYAELTTAYPRDGGEYVFLSRAFGPRVGFLFAWCGFWIVRPGNIGAMAYVFGDFGGRIVSLPRPLAASTPLLLAVAAIAGLTLVNLAGLKLGRLTQNALTLTKVLGIGVVIVVAFIVTDAPHAESISIARPLSDYRGALIMVLFTYGGWNEISYVAAEVRDPRRQFSRALVGGVVAVTIIYILFAEAERRLGAVARYHDGPMSWLSGFAQQLRLRNDYFVVALVCFSSLGAIQGMIFAGSRIYYAVGIDQSTYRWLAHWNPRHGGGTPVRSLLLQGAVTLAMVIAFGLYQDGFDAMLIFTTPVFYLFFLLAAASLFVLRWRDRDVDRPFRVPLYPLTPILFAASCAFMLWSSLTYAWDNRRWEALWSIGLLLAGVVASLWTTGGRQKDLTADERR